MQALTFSLVSTKEEVQKKDKEIDVVHDTHIDKFIEDANHMKVILFQDFKEGKHLSWNVDQFLVEQEETQEMVDELKDSEATARDAQAYFFCFVLFFLPLYILQTH